MTSPVELTPDDTCKASSVPVMDSNPSLVPLPGFTTDQNDFRVIAADFFPVGDFAGVNLRNLVKA